MRFTSPPGLARRALLEAFTAIIVSLFATFTAPIEARATSSSPTCLDKPACPAKPTVCLPRTADEVWLVSTRNLGCPDCEASPVPQVWRYDCEAHRWNGSALDAFLAAQNPAMHTVFWIHGNRIEAGEAQSQGLEVYRQLTYGVSGDRPIRFVIFSWPSSPIRGLKEDARVKARRTNIDGYYLAALVNRMNQAVRVDIIGYSFGARIATG